MSDTFKPEQEVKAIKINWKELMFKLITQHKKKTGFKKLLEDMSEEEQEIIMSEYEKWLRK